MLNNTDVILRLREIKGEIDALIDGLTLQATSSPPAPVFLCRDQQQFASSVGGSSFD